MAAKTNLNESEIDKSSFFWNSLCAICHPGGGPGESDRDGYRYYDAETGQFGYQLSGADPTYDGDYSVLDATGSTLNPAPWNVTGISEPDCLYCHRQERTVSGPMNMNWIWRAATLRGSAALVDDLGASVPAFASAPTAGQGWFSNLELDSVPPGMPPMATTLQIDYSVGVADGSLVADEGGNLHVASKSLGREPKDYACWGCHAMAEMKKRGQVWFDQTWDVHYAGHNNLSDEDPSNDISPSDSKACNYCHPGDAEHSIVKGNAFAGTVRDDADYVGMRTCRDCHLAELSPGVPNPLKDPDAPEPEEDIHIAELAGDMLTTFSCQACHIAFAATAADLVVDHAVSGNTVTYSTEAFLSADPLNPSDPDKTRWYPALKWKTDSDGVQRLFPIKPLLSMWWADWDQKETPGDLGDDVIAPIPLWKVRQITGAAPLPGATDDNGDGEIEVNRLAEVNIYIQALKGNDSYGRPVAANPVLIKGGRVWYEDLAAPPDNVSSFDYEGTGIAVESTHAFSMDHNVLPPSEALGDSCDTCHRDDGQSPVLDRLVLTDPFDVDGQPLYEMVRDQTGIVAYHGRIDLKDTLGNVLTVDSTLPYSGRQTCGTAGCHDLDDLAGLLNGYHFQQGRTDAAGIVHMQNDFFGDGRDFVLSPGMYGKWCVCSPDDTLLASKLNANESAIDKTSFYWVSLCGICHPGGGTGEFDRDGEKYYNIATGQFGYEISGSDPTYNGDYALIDPSTGAYSAAPWDVTGVSEPDCLYCHRRDRTIDAGTGEIMNWVWRAATLRGAADLVDNGAASVPAFEAAATAAEGWFSNIELATVPPGEPPLATVLQIDYSVGVADGSLIANPDDTLQLRPGLVIREPKDYACWGCHTGPDRKKRGQVWFDPDWDVHYAGHNNLTDADPSNDIPAGESKVCNTCHPGNPEHMIAKGNAPSGSVHDETDYLNFRTCRDCHLLELSPGVPNPLKDPDAPDPVFEVHFPEFVVGDMINKISCQGCHIPYAGTSAELVVDYAVTGTTVAYDTDDFLSADPLDPTNPDKTRWYPSLMWKEDSDGVQRLFPNKLMLSLYWADWDRNGTPGDLADDKITPIALWRVRQITGNAPLPGVTDDSGDGQEEVNRLAEIDLYIQALKGNDSYGQPVAANPVLVKGGKIWHEDGGQPENVNSFDYAGTGIAVESTRPFGMDHNVLVAREGWGSDEFGAWACGHCHLFGNGGNPTKVMDRLILSDPFGTDGQPVYKDMREITGLDPI